MIIRGLILVSFFLHIGLTANVRSRERKEKTFSECAAIGGECDEIRVCGTDDRTYPSRCHLLRAQCSGHQVSLKYRGPCKACKEARDYAIKHFSNSTHNFIPNCKRDGTYASIQCLGDTGCWCSDFTGKPIDNTTVRIGRPKCGEFNKSNTRRSPARHLDPSRTRRTCTQIDRDEFKDNLLKVFKTEFMRSGQHQRNIAAAGLDTTSSRYLNGIASPQELTVLNWKFSSLDLNTNQMLDKNEFRKLKKLIKLAVKPRRCGRAFGKFCDVDGNKRLTRNEWNSCLSKDDNNRHSKGDFNVPHGFVHHNGKINVNQNPNNNNNYNKNAQNNFDNNNRNRHKLVPNHINIHHSNNNNNNHKNLIISNNNKNINNNNNKKVHETSLDELTSESEADETDDSSQDYADEADADDDEDIEDIDDDNDEQSRLNINCSSTKFPLIYNLSQKSESTLKDSEVETDCLMDREAALEEQHHGGTILYVPECTPEGRYQRVQCYQSTPYCWCVNEESGKPIPETSVKDKKPQCDTIYSATRTMKGCPEPRKTEFLKDLKLFLKTKIPASIATGKNATKWNSEDERIGTLSFVLLDKNKSKSWERKEWKMFRELVTSSKNLRKCGKKMPRYCDVNSDKKITPTEWLNCLQSDRVELSVTQKSNQSNESVTSKPSKLIGSNPLEQYLKD